MSKDSRFDRHELLVAAATIAAHANSGADGFRNRDVRFLIELFSNWIETAIGAPVLPVQNNQVARYLEALVREGCARKLERRQVPLYRLTRVGLLDLLSRITSKSYCHAREEFFFLHSFINNYRERLIDLVKKEGQHFPPAIQLELAQLLDGRELLTREVTAARFELKKLDQRMADVEAGAVLASKKLRQGAALEEILKELEKKHPYQLNNQKPLSALLGQLPAEHTVWELTEGQSRRQQQIFKPLRAMLVGYIYELEKLQK